jgi:hypothetical protein
MKTKQLKDIIRQRVQQAMENGINPDVLLDSIRKNNFWVSQEDFDTAVASLPELKIYGLRLYIARYLCSCGCIKSPDSYFCTNCTQDWKESLRFDA